MKTSKNQKIKSEYLSISKSIITQTNHPLHDCLFKYSDLVKYKVFLLCLHQANKTIISMNKQNLDLKAGSFNLQTFYSRKNFLCNSYISINEIIGGILRIEKTTNTDFNAFFNKISLDEDGETINFEFSDLYMRELNKKSFYKVNLVDLKPLKSIRALRLAIIILSTKSGYKGLNYLINVLEVETYKRNGQPKKRTNIIKDINIALDNFNHLIFHVYQKPKNQYVAIKEGDFKFHYETLEQIEKEKNAKYITILDAWHELDHALKIEKEQDFDKIFNADDLILN
jgi:hypothetical protein